MHLCQFELILGAQMRHKLPLSLDDLQNYCCFIGQYDDLAALQVQYSLSKEVI